MGQPVEELGVVQESPGERLVGDEGLFDRDLVDGVHGGVLGTAFGGVDPDVLPLHSVAEAGSSPEALGEGGL